MTTGVPVPKSICASTPGALHPPERQLVASAETPDEALDAVVTAVEAVIGLEILPDALGAESDVELLFDNRLKRLTPTRRPGPGGRVWPVLV